MRLSERTCAIPFEPRLVSAQLRVQRNRAIGHPRVQVIQEEYRGARQWSRNRQAVATVVWISFLTAAVATMVFFAVFDPTELSGALGEDIYLGRQAGYAVGFFFFWVLTAVAAGITAWLVRTAPKRDENRR